MELPAPSKPTSLSPKSQVTDVTKDKEQIEDISAEILAQRFAKFLSEEKGEDTDIANKFGDLLAEFIDGKVPEIAAIQSLRELMRTDYQLPKKTYTQAKAEDPALTPAKWFDVAYKQGAAMGVVNAQTVRKTDQSFPVTFNRLRPDGLSLGETIEVAKSSKYSACQTLLSAPVSTVTLFLEQTHSGAPTHKK
uniref:hypothetical protein n=1 Tax=Ruegeria sp. PR1b TaxID=185588 RepID=UPI00146A6F16|nr:hypothetical protein [Ruegeria sp. PR1b]